MWFGPVYSRRQCRLCKGRSMYRYKDHKLGGGTRAHKVHKLGWGTRAHEVYKEYWQVGGTTGTGVLLRHPVPSWGVLWLMWLRSMCHGWYAVVDMPWPSVVLALSEILTIYLHNRISALLTEYPSVITRVFTRKRGKTSQEQGGTGVCIKSTLFNNRTRCWKIMS